MSSSDATDRPEPTVAGETTAVKARRKLSLAKKVLFSVATLVTFFGLFELVLFLAGIEPLGVDVYQGFSSSVPVFVEQKRSDDRIENGHIKRQRVMDQFTAV